MLIIHLTLITGAALIVLHRNNKTFRLRNQITDICGEYTLKQIRNGVYDDNALEWCDEQLPSYNRMVLSFHKRLRIQDWLTTEQITKLNNI
jgi:hypothetical protein